MSLYSKLKKLTESKNIGVKKELRKSLYSKLKKLSRSKRKTEKRKYMMKLNQNKHRKRKIKGKKRTENEFLFNAKEAKKKQIQMN